MTRLASFLVLALTVVPAAANAQEPPAPVVGAQVRIWTAQAMAPVTGKVVQQDAASLTFLPDGGDDVVSVKREAITRMDVSLGRRTTRQSVFTGILIGAGAAIAMGLIAGDDPENQWLEFSAEQKALAFGILTVPAGALIGAIVGPGPEHWTTATPSSAKLSQTIASPTPSLRFSFRF